MEFVLQNPVRIVFGKGVASRVGAELAAAGHRKVLLLAGGGSIRLNGAYSQVCDSMKTAGVEWTEVWDIRPNPVLSKVREIIALAKSCGAEALVAVGGGSVVDTAKAAAAGVFTDDVWDLFEGKARISKALPIYTVLTLSATGSEMNHIAVVTNEATKQKWNVLARPLYPRISFIDPHFQTGLPWNQVVNGTVDSMAHMLEYYFSAPDFDTSLSICEALFEVLIRSTDRLIQDQHDREALSSRAWAATMAFNGISAAGLGGGDWLCHGLEHGMSALYPDVAHGAGLAVIIPAWMSFHWDYRPERFRRFAKRLFNVEDKAACLKAVREKFSSWKAPQTLEDLGIPVSAIPEIARKTTEAGRVGSIAKLNQKGIEGLLLQTVAVGAP